MWDIIHLPQLIGICDVVVGVWVVGFMQMLVITKYTMNVGRV
jgi:hypothetical protein